MEFNEGVIKRIKKQPDAPHRGMPCVLCGKTWDTCPHDVGQVRDVLAAYRGLKFLVKGL